MDVTLFILVPGKYSHIYYPNLSTIVLELSKSILECVSDGDVSLRNDSDEESILYLLHENVACHFTLTR